MIVVDTSAMMAVIIGEAQGEACERVLSSSDTMFMSAGTLTEALVVASRKGNFSDELQDTFDRFEISIEPVTEQSARAAAAAYDLWGKGVHPAGLNLADCFAYELAIRLDCPLLFVGEDFARTDVKRALP